MDLAQWQETVLTPLLEHTDGEPPPELQALLDDDVVELLSADTDQTQGYVLESVKLPEIRGASELLETLNVEEIPALFDEHGLPRECILVAGGGSLLALVPPGYGERLAPAIERLYPERTDAATITCDWRPITPRMVLEGYPQDAEAPFGALIRWASTWLRRRKEDKPPGPFFEAPPHATRCRSCQQRPAHKVLFAAEESWPICTVCHHKTEWIGRKPGRGYWIKLFDKHLSDEQESAYYREGRYSPHETGLAADLEAIGDACAAREGYVGLVYLDGDGVGDFMQSHGTAQAYRGAATELTKTALHATIDALAAHLHVVEGDDGPYHPFEIITVGGDDVLLIVPGDVALPIATDISIAFGQAMAEHGLTMSAGVVIADDHNPVRVLLQLSKELLANAKQARHRLEDGQQGMIDFHVLLSQDMLAEKIKKVRRGFPYQLVEIDDRGIEVQLRLLGRPYTAQRMAALWEAMEDLAETGFPRSQMHRLAESLLTGRRSSTLFYVYQRARRDTQAAYHALDQVIRTAHALEDTFDPEPWFKLPKDPCYAYATALWDIAELYDFVS
jgi:CRISPR-associated protein Cmr2